MKLQVHEIITPYQVLTCLYPLLFRAPYILVKLQM